MYQGLAGDVSAVIESVADAGLDVSLCTIVNYNRTKDADGAPIYVPGAPVVGLTNIPCMDAPLATDAIQATELKALAEIMSKGLRHVLLIGYYPTITSDQWAIVDGTTYDILGVESDSQNSQTRLKLQLVGV